MNLPRLSIDLIDDLAVEHLGNPGKDPEKFARAVEDAQLALIEQHLREQKPVAYLRDVQHAVVIQWLPEQREKLSVGDRLYAAPVPASQGDGERLKLLEGLLEELVVHDNHETEYDGNVLTICPECGEQDGEHLASCAFVRAKAALAAPATTKEAEG